MTARFATVLFLAAGAIHAQQLHWQIPSPPSPHGYYRVASYADHDGDGCRDLLVNLFLNELQPNAILATRIVSGMTGATLWERQDPNDGVMIDAGDMDGDSVHDIVLRGGLGANGWIVRAWSVGHSTLLWQVANPGYGFGDAMLGDVDLDGDGHADFITSTLSTFGSDVYAYNCRGQLLYVIPCLALGRAASSFAKMGDMDNDGADDYVVGCQDVTSRGLVMLVSGRTGTVLRQSYGLLPGDNIANHASNMGDLDGDGVNDYAGFPWWSAARAMITVFSGQTGAVIRTWPEFASSVITGEDVDLDGVPDLVLGADYPVQGTYGRTYAFSGRDGSELWRVDNVVLPPPTSTGTSNWMEHAATVGVRPGEHYPSIAWFDAHWFTAGTLHGRIRSYTTALAGQGPVTGTGCASSGNLPLIGARRTAAGARITLAKGPSGGLGLLFLSLASETTYGGALLPIDLSFLGLLGCHLQVAPTVTALRVLGTAGIDRGYAAYDAPFALTSSALGVSIAAQWLVLDPATGGHAATRRHELRGM